jgi:dihydrofolate reductase
VAKLIVNEFLTLDGVMQGPGAPDEDRSGGFDKGGWQMGYGDDSTGEFVDASLQQAGSFLIGRRTYDIFAAYWPHAGDVDIADTMNSTRKYVASRTLTEPLPWQNSVLLQGDAAQAVARLKETEERDMLVWGSGDLVQTLLANNLVDELRLVIYPIVLGEGKRLFKGESASGKFRLSDSKIAPTGVLLLTYVPASA